MNVHARFDEIPSMTLQDIKENVSMLQKPLRITKENNSHRIGPLLLNITLSICPLDMNVYTRFDEIPSMTLHRYRGNKTLQTHRLTT